MYLGKVVCIFELGRLGSIAPEINVCVYLFVHVLCIIESSGYNTITFLLKNNRKSADLNLCSPDSSVYNPMGILNHFGNNAIWEMTVITWGWSKVFNFLIRVQFMQTLITWVPFDQLSARNTWYFLSHITSPCLYYTSELYPSYSYPVKSWWKLREPNSLIMVK